MTRHTGNHGTGSGYVAFAVAGTAVALAVCVLAVLAVCVVFLVACAASAT